MRSEPLPVSENQQGHFEPVEAEVATADAIPVMEAMPTLTGLHLWCQDPHGHACSLAQAALKARPEDVGQLPADLLAVEDLSNDCDEPTILSVSHRLATAFSVQPTGWRDQGGSWLDASLISDMYQAAGCINDADPARPIAKISAASGASPREYLVRVWEGQQTSPY